MNLLNIPGLVGLLLSKDNQMITKQVSTTSSNTTNILISTQAHQKKASYKCLSQHTSTAHKANDGINLPVHKNAMKVIGIIKYKKEKWEEAMLLGKGIWITATLCKVISSKNNKLVEVFLFLFELSKSIILNLNVLTLFVG